MTAIVVAAILGATAIVCMKMLMSCGISINVTCSQPKGEVGMDEKEKAELIAAYQKKLDEDYEEQQKQANEVLRQLQNIMFTDDPVEEASR